MIVPVARRLGLARSSRSLGFEKHFLHKLFHADALFGRYVLTLVLAAPFLYEVVHCGEFLLDFVRVGVGFVYLVDCKYDRYTCCRCVVDSLYGLWHDVVVGSHDDNHKVGYLCASGTHCRECFVAWGVEECYVASVGELHAVQSRCAV